jgi:MFS family permease
MLYSIMASSLQPQLQMLLSSSDYCGTLSSSYLRSILDCAYAFGGTTGLFWGYLAGRMGRRRVTLIGLWSMFACCLSMGFATSLVSCTIFRFVAGMVSSAIVCTTLTMIGDLSTSAEERAKNVARLPTISLGGSMGPIMQLMVSESLQAYNMVWQDFPTLGSELACGAVLFAIALTASICLKETLPHHNDRSADSVDMDCEKAAFLRRDSEATATSTTATVAEATTAAAASTATTATATTEAAATVVLTRLSVVDTDGTATDLLAVQSLKSGGSLLLGAEVDVSETLEGTSVAVSWERDTGDVTVLLENLLDALVGALE